MFLTEYLEKALLPLKKYLFRFRIRISNKLLILSSRKAISIQGARNMVRKAIIEILLVPESLDKRSDEIEEEILKAFRDGFLVIPWSYDIEKIRVLET